MKIGFQIQICILIILIGAYVIRVSTVRLFEPHLPDSEGVYVARVVTEPNVDQSRVRLNTKIIRTCKQSLTHGLNSCADLLMSGDTSVTFFTKSVEAVLESAGIREIKIGDELRIQGKLQRAKDCAKIQCKETEIGFANYMKKERVFTEIISPKFVGIVVPENFLLSRRLVDIRKSMENKIDESIPRPESDLGKGLIISGKGSMSDELLDDFKKVGLIHIVVLSGSNVSIISVALFSILSKLPSVVKSVFGILLMIMFAIMTGASPPVVRSVMMSAVPIMYRITQDAILSARKIARKKVPLSDISEVPDIDSVDLKQRHPIAVFAEQNASVFSLVCIGLVLSIHNPLLPIYDMSFQLSFMATLGLMTLSGPVSSVLTWIPQKYSIREIVSCSLATQVFVLPLLLTISDSMSTLFIFANLLVLPVLPLTMLFTFVAALSSFIIEPFAPVFNYVSWIMLRFIIWVADYFSSFSFSVVTLKTLEIKDVLVIYMFIVPISLMLKYIYEAPAQKCETSAAGQ